MPRKPQPRDPNLDHPAVKLYQDICRSTPNHIQRALIAATVTQCDVYRAVLTQFMLESRPPQRVDWTLERYTNATADRGRDLSVPPAVAGGPPVNGHPAAEQSELWEKVLGAVKPKLRGESFETWFAPVQFAGVDEGRRLIRLRAPNQVVRDWIKVNYVNLLDQSFGEVGLAGYSVVWVLPESKSAGGAV